MGAPGLARRRAKFCCCRECALPVGYCATDRGRTGRAATEPRSKARVFAGQILCALWYIFFPVILVWYSFRIFVVECITSYMVGFCGRFWLTVGRLACCCCKCRCWRHRTWCVCFQYIDEDFPHTDESLCNDSTNESGTKAFRSKAAQEAGRSTKGGVEWKRIEDILTFKAHQGTTPCLFADEIEPADIDQGGLGDCWLMAAFAALTMSPGAIQNCFKTQEYDRRGCYEIRLYDGRIRKFVTIVIDDYVPVHKQSVTEASKGKVAEPLFAHPHDNELWVLLLEKAFAKMLGSYYGLTGGLEAWALQTLTGDRVHVWTRDEAGWHENELRYRSTESQGELERTKRAYTRFQEALTLDPNDDDTRQKRDEAAKKVKTLKKAQQDAAQNSRAKGADDVAFYRTEGKKAHDNDEIFKSIIYWRKHDAVLTVGAPGEKKHSGLRGGHAYSVFGVVEAMGIQLVRLRNPWGESAEGNDQYALAAAGLWNGRWRAGDPLWADPKYATLRKHCKKEGASSEELDGGRTKGFCWVPWGDFTSFFDTMTVCHRSHGISDVRLDIHEDDGCIGPTKGCLLGCGYYWCCCDGVERLCCEVDHMHARRRGWAIG